MPLSHGPPDMQVCALMELNLKMHVLFIITISICNSCCANLKANNVQFQND